MNRSLVAMGTATLLTSWACASSQQAPLFEGDWAFQALLPFLAAFSLWNKAGAKLRDTPRPEPKREAEPVDQPNPLQAAQDEVEELKLKLSQIRAVQNASLVRYHAMFEELPLPCFTLNEDGHIMEWNKAAEKVFGYSQAEVADKPLREVLGHYFFLGRAEETIYLVFMGRRVDCIDVNIDGPDGVSRSVKWYPSPVLDSSNRVVGVVNTLAMVPKPLADGHAA